MITLFLLPDINLKLRPKLLDLKPGTRIASNTFTWTTGNRTRRRPRRRAGSWCTALFWVVPAKVAGSWQLGNQALTLTQKFQVISGTLGTTTITDGKVNGEEVTFNAGGRNYIGHVNGTTITGSGWSATRK